MESAGGDVSLIDKDESNVRAIKFHNQRQTKLEETFVTQTKNNKHNIFSCLNFNDTLVLHNYYSETPCIGAPFAKQKLPR